MFYGHFSIAVWRVLTTLAAHKCTEFIIIAKENVTESQLSDDTRRVLVVVAWSKVVSASSHKNDDDTSHFKAPSLLPFPLCLSFLSFSLATHNGGNNH